MLSGYQKVLSATLVVACSVFVVQQMVHQEPSEIERDLDDGEYEYDPYENSGAGAAPDEEGQSPPSPKWHACRFASKKGGIYDIRPLSRNKKLLKAASTWSNNLDFPAVDWVHNDETIANQTYYLNVCSDVHLVPPACKDLQKLDPAPAFEVNPAGGCFYLGAPNTSVVSDKLTQPHFRYPKNLPVASH
jgi:hypothetical protein